MGSFAAPATTVVDRLRYRAINQADKRAFTYLVDGEDDALDLTYGELDRQARAIAAQLEALGMVGERALLLYPPGLEFIAAFFGCLYAGTVAVTAYPPRRNRNMLRIQAISDDAEAKVALSEHSVMERVEGMLDEAPHLKQLRWIATDRLPPELADDWSHPDIDGDTLAFLQYTSGSTGTPKGVILTHTNLMHNSALIANAFETARGHEGCFWLPMYHDMGLIGGIMQPMYVGGPNTLISPMAFLQKPFRWLDIISRRRITHSGGPNFAYELCVRKVNPEQRAKLDLSSWDLAFTGAEPVRADTIDRFCEAFEPCGFRREAFFPCYGMAEATLMISGGIKRKPPVIMTVDGDALDSHQVTEAEPDEDSARRVVGCGGNLPDQEIVIVDPETHRPLPPENVGEIWAAGPSIAKGYWNKPEITRETFEARLDGSGRGPFLRTGDLGFLCEGELFVTGRIKDLIIIRGVNKYPQDIEATVQGAHPWLREDAGAAVVAEVDGEDRLIIVNEVSRAKGKSYDEVFTAIRREVAAEHEVQVDAIALIRARTIPKTSSGKIQRYACAKEYVAGTLPTLAHWRAGQAPAAKAAAKPPPAPTVAAATAPADTAPAEGSDEGVVETQPVPDLRTARIVMRQVKNVAQDRAPSLNLETNIVGLGLESLERMEIVATLEEMYGGRIPNEVLPKLRTCRDVALAVQQYLGSEPQREPPALDKPPPSPPAEILPEYYNFAAMPGYRQLQANLAQLAATGIPHPYFQTFDGVADDIAVIDGRELINFSSYNYLGMSAEPVVARAAKEAIDRYGTSVSASRLVSGEIPLHRQLERTIADFLGTADAVVFVGGHASNESAIGHLLRPGDLVLYDSKAQNSFIHRAALSGARRRPYPHNDWRALDALLTEIRRDYRKVLIAAEGVYSMDGDYPELPHFLEIKKKHKALLMIDEAHSLGTMGRHGRGIGEHFDLDPREVDIWMGTLDKAIGSCGGYIAGSEELIEYLKYTAPGFVYSAGLSPPNAAAALVAFRLLEEEPERVARCQARSQLFLKLARERELNTGLSNGTPIVPIITGNSLHALMLSRQLFERGIKVQPILYPVVEEEAARLRFFVTALHSEEHLRRAVDAVAEDLSEIDPKYALPQRSNPRSSTESSPAASQTFRPR
jgi:8-amino-7-oxononanoate synthase